MITGVVQYKDGKEIGRFLTVENAARKTGISASCIVRVLRGQNKSTYGYTFSNDIVVLPHKHKCSVCKKMYTCTKQDPGCMRTKEGLCPACWNKILNEEPDITKADCRNVYKNSQGGKEYDGDI